MSKSILRNTKINGKAIFASFIFKWSLKNLSQNLWTDIAYGPENTLVVTGLNNWSYSIDNGSTWAALSTINPDFGNEFHNAVAYGNGKWSILEYLNNPPSTNICWTSTNILTGWTKSNFLSGTGTTLNPIFSTFGYPDMLFNPHNNKFIAFVDQRNQTILTTNAIVVHSNDGVNWLSGGYFEQNGTTPITTPQGFGHGVVGTYMPNNRLVACGGGGGHKFGYSDNGGITWIIGKYNPNSLGQNLQVGHSWGQVSYGSSAYLPISGRYVAVNIYGSTSTFQFAYSDDGIDWKGVSFPTGNPLKKNWKTITYAAGYFVALSDINGYQAQSADGINWNIYQELPYTNTNSVGDTVVANRRIIALYDSNIAGSNVAISDF